MAWSTLIVGVAAVTVLVISLAGAQAPNDAEFQKFILEGHNKLRSKEGGANMNELVWDSQLAQESKQWADRCVFEHQMKERGENLAFNTEMDWKKTTGEAIQAWFDEKNDYRSFGAKCSQYNACHYTQVVWADTRRVGCSLKKCDRLGNSGANMPSLYLVCFYDPRANWEWDQNHPYIRGAACSKCQSDQTCKNNLCSGGGDPCFDKESADKCSMWANSMNQCQQNKQFMEMNCKQSCGFCKGGGGKPAGKPAAECKDDEARCASWAQKNECTKNPSYMKMKCKKSCGAC